MKKLMLIMLLAALACAATAHLCSHSPDKFP